MKNIPAETTEALERFRTNISLRLPVISCYLLLTLILREGFFIPFPYIVFGILSWMLISPLFLSFYFENFTPSAKTIINGLFLYMLFDLFVITLIIYFLGGLSWAGFIFYSFYLLLNFMTFPRHYAIFLTFWIVFLFLGLSLSQYFNFLPPQSLFPLETQTYFNFSYVLTTTIAFAVTIFLVAYFGRGFYQMYAVKIKDLRKIESTLEGEKAALETRVQARKKELGEEKEKLEERIRVRAKELEKESRELEERAEELAKFQKVAHGRELKMEELKKELAQLRIELKS